MTTLLDRPRARFGAWTGGRRGRTAPTAYERVLRRLAAGIGVSGTIWAFGELPEIVVQGHGQPTTWSVLAATMSNALFPVLAVTSVRARPATLRALAAAGALSYLAAYLTLPLMVQPHTIDTGSLWLYRMLPTATLLAGLAWRRSLALGYVLVGSAAEAQASVYCVDPLTVSSWLAIFARSAGLSVLFLWCASSALRAAGRVDLESRAAGRRAAATAAATARDRERARFAALIHDGVLFTLLGAARGSQLSGALQRQAAATLAELDRYRHGGTSTGEMDARTAFGYLRGAVEDIDPTVVVHTDSRPDSGGLQIPVPVVVTVAAALAEATRNSVRHAAVPGRTVRRQLRIVVGSGGIRVVLTDDGAGFDPAAVPVDRLGIAASILGRMRQLSGGAGFVESRPGAGTTVALAWGGDGTD
ncbi:sensor histidine kinase [Nocardia stercoris]|uniref:ATP-binding protein n=1 Tax=Nocardia stercoris TaxID=2483361 RepID=A0A3M2KTD3_9NOCA|nr:ATP-binding protein [Nocardia stercoris]RMI27936.1 ATP-binding protein [Nocardia stercoris]